MFISNYVIAYVTYCCNLYQLNMADPYTQQLSFKTKLTRVVESLSI